ncbi:unnamed protein product [Owenia fusiformis]|uniref:Cytosol aminopeptidase n=1 Tax=Owenia fusiformis TaxID=6347 RepID=A0A8S4NMW1_OWEFU|nr:unnamed protein product [Owenia fusiformis]
MSAPMKYISNLHLKTINAAFRAQITKKNKCNLVKRLHHCESSPSRRGLIVGAYVTEDKHVELTPTAREIDTKTGGKLTQLVQVCGGDLKQGACRVLHGADDTYTSISLVGLGKPQLPAYDEAEGWNPRSENVRSAIAAGVRSLRDVSQKIEIDPCGNAEAAAEGAVLSLFNYDRHKSEKKPLPEIECHSTDRSAVQGWKTGRILAEGQNFARSLMETPSNHLTPLKFAETIQEQIGNIKGVEITPRNAEWAKERNMGCFLAVGQGSQEESVFLEVSYTGSDDSSAPLALVGKGITFDTGGISIKPSAGMEAMRADMGGAACVAGTLLSISQLQLPINVKCVMPLAENMPSGSAIKPGDVVTASNGKTVQIDNTDAEGRLVLADALCYVQSTYSPRLILDMATLTGAIDVALGSAATGVFTNSSPMWDLLHKAGAKTGDRMWRMPLYKHYSKQVTECHLADVHNIGKYSRAGGSCTAAAFLREFVTNDQWLHLDIAGVMENKDEVTYLSKGMAGRPTRTIVEFIRLLAQSKQT